MHRLLLILLFFISNLSFGQNQSEDLVFPVVKKLPARFRKAIESRKKEYDRLFYLDSATTKHYTVAFMLDKIDNDSNYYYIFLAEYWIAYHYQEMIPELIKRINDKKETGLVNAADLLIPERLLANQMKFYGHGGFSADDLFTIAGRANRLLTLITGEYYGYVSMYSDQAQLEELQKKWIKWLKKLKR
jgi:hypothetical protein